MKTSYYNIHNLITIKLCYGESENKNYFDRRLGHFKSLGKYHSDINIYFNIFPAGITKSSLKKYSDKRKIIYDKSRKKLAKWETYIYNIKANETDIIFLGNRFSLKYLFFNFLEPIVNYKLIDKGFCLVHSSCFSFGNKGYLINAYPSSGKTSILLRMLKRGANYLSDEMTIISKDGFSYSYPTPLYLFDYSLKKDFFRNLGMRKLIKMYLFKIVRILTRGTIKFPIEIDPIILLNGGDVVNMCRIKVSCLIDKFSVSGLSKKQTEMNILKINQWQYRYFNKLIESHIKGNKESSLRNYWSSMANIISDFCNKVDIIVINNESEFEEKVKMI